MFLVFEASSAGYKLDLVHHTNGLFLLYKQTQHRSNIIMIWLYKPMFPQQSTIKPSLVLYLEPIESMYGIFAYIYHKNKPFT